jgi:hypothetical protein
MAYIEAILFENFICMVSRWPHLVVVESAADEKLIHVPLEVGRLPAISVFTCRLSTAELAS